MKDKLAVFIGTFIVVCWIIAASYCLVQGMFYGHTVLGIIGGILLALLCASVVASGWEGW